MNELVKAEGIYKNASYVAENRWWGIKIGFEQPAEGNLALPTVKLGKGDSVFGVMAPGSDDDLIYRNRRNIEVNSGGETLPGAAAISADETIIGIGETLDITAPNPQ
jgi:hypothetical protein